MAWIDLANNQMVSFTDAQTSGIALNAGQSHVTSNECMTKTQIQAKYNVLTAPMDSYASNQLVEKEKWSSAVAGLSTVSVTGISSSQRFIDNHILNSGGTFQDGTFVLARLCENNSSSIIEMDNTVIQSTQNVRIVIKGGATELYFWTYKVFNMPSNTLHFIDNGSVTAGSSDVNVNITVTGLTPGAQYYFQAIVQSDICPV
jgi:hypothetical protein